MSIRARNYEEIEKRGALQARYGEFVIYKCSGCGAFALYDNEHLQIYLNPDDLSNSRLYGIEDREKTGEYNAPCPCCKAVNTFEEALDEDFEQVLKSPWSFSLK